MPYSHQLSTNAERVSLTAWAAVWDLPCLQLLPYGHTPPPPLTATSCPLFTLTIHRCLRSICPAKPRGRGPARCFLCGSPLWSSHVLLTPTLFLCHMSSWASLTSRVVMLYQMGCTTPTHKVHSREQERAAVGDSLLMLGHSFHCQALQQDGGLVTWPNLPRMNFKWRQQLVLQLLYMEPEDFSTVYLCCYCQAGPLPGSAMIGHKRRQMQKTWLLWF